MHRLETDNFKLEFKPDILDIDMGYPVDTILHVKVVSYDFSATATMDVSADEVAAFTEKLSELYETLSGNIKLEEPYGTRNYIEFEAAASGHIKVKGTLVNERCGHTQELSFENEFDQTYLQSFAKGLLNGTDGLR